MFGNFFFETKRKTSICLFAVHTSKYTYYMICILALRFGFCLRDKCGIGWLATLKNSDNIDIEVYALPQGIALWPPFEVLSLSESLKMVQWCVWSMKILWLHYSYAVKYPNGCKSHSMMPSLPNTLLSHSISTSLYHQAYG